MTHSVPRRIVEAFYQAYVSRDPDRIGACLHDEVEWLVTGPVEVMQVCGHWHGKTAVIDRFARQVPQVIGFRDLQIEQLLVDGEASAMCGRIVCVHRRTGRLISHRVAHFVRYCDEKVISFLAINDSLDAAEQFMDRRVDFPGPVEPSDGDLIVI